MDKIRSISILDISNMQHDIIYLAYFMKEFAECRISTLSPTYLGLVSRV